ncbi:MAG: 3-keto-disaccharide hydrolase, partial [Flavitalea sp.]
MYTKNKVAIVVIIITSLVISSFEWKQEKDNVLSDAEKKAGWKLLFDGNTTKGWRMYQDKPSDGWEVVQGELISKKEGVTKRADLITADQYDNFELVFDWKVEKGANSGVIYRALENDKPSFESGPEYQLIDDNGYVDKLEDWQKSGADYAMHAPSTLAAKPVGEYNRTKIVVNKGHVEHWLNGVKVVEFELWTPEWQQLKAQGKWKDAKDYGMAKKG